MGNIGKRTTVNKGRRSIDGLNQVWLNRIFKDQGKSPFHFQITDINWTAIIAVTDHNISQTAFQIFNICRQAKDGHNLRSNCNIKTVFTRNPIQRTTKTYTDMAQSTVIQIHYPFPNNATLVNTELISLMQMIVNQS